MTPRPRPTFHPRPHGAEWRPHAACLGEDPELFFPSSGDGVSAPLLICQRCPVRRECATEAMEEHFGVWGGLTEQDRKALRRGGRVVRTGPLLCRNGLHVLTHPGRCLQCAAVRRQRDSRKRQQLRDLSLSGGGA